MEKATYVIPESSMKTDTICGRISCSPDNSIWIYSINIKLHASTNNFSLMLKFFIVMIFVSQNFLLQKPVPVHSFTSSVSV